MKSESRLLWTMGAFGFASGLPLSLTAFTLQLWFTSFGLSVHAIGMTAMLGLPYTLKFLWSGLFDRPPPGTTLRGFGRRRGWLLAVQPLLAASAAALALSDPRHAPALTICAALTMAFLSASQDVLIDAWRIEIFPQRLQGAALAVYIWGYRGAMVTSTSGALWLASVAGWRIALLAMAALLAAGTLLTLFAPAPSVQPATILPGWRAGVRLAFLAPLRDFLGRQGATAVLAFVILFRLGKVFADQSAAALYRYGLHFSPAAIGSANFFGTVGLLAGAGAGGWLVLRLGMLRALLVTGLFQAASLGLYLVLLAYPNQAMLTAKIVLESFAGSAADMAFLTYVSALCSRAYTATQYALLSSLAAVAFHTLGGLSGYAAEALGYRAFYAASVLASLPALVLLWHLGRKSAHPPHAA